MDEKEFKDRTKRFAIRIIHLVEALPRTKSADVIGRQLLRSATSVGANYRAACRAKSPADMLNKLGTVEEECDETIYWIEPLIEAEIVTAERLKSLMEEANEILAMVVASKKTLRNKVVH